MLTAIIIIFGLYFKKFIDGTAIFGRARGRREGGDTYNGDIFLYAPERKKLLPFHTGM